MARDYLGIVLLYSKELNDFLIMTGFWLSRGFAFKELLLYKPLTTESSFLSETCFLISLNPVDFLVMPVCYCSDSLLSDEESSFILCYSGS